MKYLSNERGAFSVLAAILVVVLVAVVGVAVYNMNKSHQKAAETASTSPSPSTSPVTSTSPTATATPTPTASGYLVVSQWGVKLPASGVLANLQYSIVNGYVMFYTSELYPKYPACGPGGIGSLSRLTKGASNEPVNTAISAGTINGYDYFYSEAQQPCVQGASTTSADEQLETNQQNALIQEMRQLKLAPAQ